MYADPFFMRPVAMSSQWKIVALLLLASSGFARADVSRFAAPAVYANVQYAGFKLQRKDFNFSSYRAWLKRSGDWHIEGTVSHRGLLCGTYEVGMRFGIGKNGCTEVEWITTDRYATSQLQCNNATMNHQGGDNDSVLAARFDEITCAERVVRCSGNCK